MRKKTNMTNEEMRAASLAAARRNFSDFGFFGARVDAIATQANVNKRMIYEFYASKKGLYRAVLNQVANEIDERVQQDIPLTGDWNKDIRTIFFWYLRLYKDNPDFVRLIMWESLTLSEDGSVVLGVAAKATDRIYAIFKEGIEKGYFKAHVNKTQLVLSSFMTQGYFANMLLRRKEVARVWGLDLNDPVVDKAVVESMVELFFNIYSKA